MPRMLRRAAVLGATAHVASKAGAARGAAAQASADQAAAEQAPPPEPPPAPPAPAVPATDVYDELTKLKGLLDAGVLTQEEFDAEKAKLLAR
ncbi:SHOCT domain-containing protein [Cellulomonas sp. P5_C6]